MNTYQKNEILNESQFNETMLSTYIPVNVWTIKLFGLDAAVMLAELYQEYLYKRRKKQLKDFGVFECSVNKVKFDTGLSAERQKKAIEKLRNAGIIIKIRPAFAERRKFSFNFSSITSLEQQIFNLRMQHRDEYPNRVKAAKAISEKFNKWFDDHTYSEIEEDFSDSEFPFLAN